MERVPSRDAAEFEQLLFERDEEIRQLRLALDVLSPIDPTTGMLNRNGVIDAIQDALNWLIRRNDAFAVMTIEIAGLSELRGKSAEEHQAIHQHLEAVLAATLRRVDKVGHLDDVTYAAILREFKTEGSTVLIDRLNTILEAETSRAGMTDTGPAFTLAVVKPGPFHQAGLLLEQVESMKNRAAPDRPLIIEI